MNYRELLLRRTVALSEDDAPRALSPVQLRNRQSMQAWRERWAEYHRSVAPAAVRAPS